MQPFDPAWWDDHYRAESTALGSVTPYVESLANLPPGTALDAGCGTGADAIWLAEHGWTVTAVDVAAAAIERAHDRRVQWLVADLTTWTPPGRFDLVLSQYVHPVMPLDRFVARLAGMVGAGGTLLVVGHDHDDPHSIEHAPHDVSASVDVVTGALDPEAWTVEAAGTHPRITAEQRLVDTVVRARRRT